MDNSYLDKNKKAWNEKTPVHISSSFYDMPSFIAGQSTLKEIELPLLGDLNNKSVLHLQCHFGQDTISMARMGACATGIDFSDVAIEKARGLAAELGVNASFVCSDVYSLPQNLQGKFDVVFTSYGTIGWLPDLEKWAAVIRHFLKPGGKFVMADFHPTLWMFDNDFTYVQYNYFKAEPIVETLSGTYADKQHDMVTETTSWNHSISELLNSLLHQGLAIQEFNEYDYSPYNCFNCMEEFEKGKFRIKQFENKLPIVYSLVATAPQ